MDLIEQLVNEHQAYVHQLMTLAEVIEGIRVNGRGDYFLHALDDLLPIFTDQLEGHAQREEEFLFPRLVERAAGPVSLMLEEHAAIRQFSREFGQWYPVWRDGDEEVLDQWVDAALGLRGAFSTHMQKENLILFPLAKRVLTPQEIQRLADF